MTATASSTSSGARQADLAVQFFKALRHTKGRWAGQPFTLLPWQERIIRDLFGTLRPDGRRQYRTAYIEIPRKAGKSTLAAAIGLYLLFEGEPGAEVYSAAADRDQASIVFEQAKAMVEGSPELARFAETFRRSIAVPRLNATYKVLSADAPTKHGLNAHGIVFDELHAQPNRELWDVLTTSTGAREQPLVVAITTAGYDRESICYELHEYAAKVRDGVIEDPSFYPCIFAAGDDAEWDAEETWYQSNPSLGETVSVEFYESEARRAREMPAYQNTFRRLYLNQWTQQHTRWIDLHLWDDNSGVVDENSMGSRECYGGLDLASVSDMTAWALVFPHADDPEMVDVLPRFWCPESKLHDSTNRYRDQYRQWAREGFLTVTPGDATDYSYVREQILRDAERFRVVDLNIDRLFQAHQLAMELENEGMAVFGMGQGFISMATPVAEFHRRLLNRKINHGGNPILRWMADGVVVRQDPAGNLKPDKANSQTKIDGIVATIMALDRHMRHMSGPRGSVYETRGLATV
jgi:phage terminase large subunit-like protein